jgi:hypothetical protein
MGCSSVGSPSPNMQTRVPRSEFSELGGDLVNCRQQPNARFERWPVSISHGKRPRVTQIDRVANGLTRRSLPKAGPEQGPGFPATGLRRWGGKSKGRLPRRRWLRRITFPRRTMGIGRTRLRPHEKPPSNRSRLPRHTTEALRKTEPRRPPTPYSLFPIPYSLFP